MTVFRYSAPNEDINACQLPVTSWGTVLAVQSTEIAARSNDVRSKADHRDSTAETSSSSGRVTPEKNPPPIPESVSETNRQRFLQWLRLLLFQLMLHINQVSCGQHSAMKIASLYQQSRPCITMSSALLRTVDWLGMDNCLS